MVNLFIELYIFYYLSPLKLKCIDHCINHTGGLKKHRCPALSQEPTPSKISVGTLERKNPWNMWGNLGQNCLETMGSMGNGKTLWWLKNLGKWFGNTEIVETYMNIWATNAWELWKSHEKHWKLRRPLSKLFGEVWGVCNFVGPLVLQWNSGVRRQDTPRRILCLTCKGHYSMGHGSSDSWSVSGFLNPINQLIPMTIHFLVG